MLHLSALLEGISFIDSFLCQRWMRGKGKELKASFQLAVSQAAEKGSDRTLKDLESIFLSFPLKGSIHLLN